MKKVYQVFLTLALAVLVGSAVPVLPVEAQLSAADCSGLGISCDDSGTEGLVNIIKNILNAIISLIAIIATIGIVIGGIMYMLAIGDEKKAERAKMTILYSVIGLVIVLLAGAIVNFVITQLGAGGDAGGDAAGGAAGGR